MSVRSARLGDIAADLRSGFACGVDDPEGIIQFRMNNVERDGLLNWAKTRRVPKAMVKNGLTLEPADILLNATNSPDLVGKTALFLGANEPITFSNHFLRIRPRSGVAEPSYIARWLRRHFELGHFKAMCRSWVNQASITRDQVANLEIPLPPLDEQRRIAAILDKADQLRQKRRQAIVLLDSLTQSIFTEMFGDPIENTKGFSMEKMSEWVSDFQTGKNLAPDTDDGNLTGFRILKVSAVTSGIFRPDETKPLPILYKPPRNHIIKKGDLLFSRANTSELIGATALVTYDYSNLVLPDKIWRFVWRDSNKPNPLFIHGLFSNTSFRREISKRASGTSGSMKNISKEKVLSIFTSQPSREEQDIYAKRIALSNECRTWQLKQLSNLEIHFSSLQHRAFTGQL